MGKLDWLTARPIAHRGLHDMNNRVWENTLPAFERAIDKGYTIELDVHLTQDGGVIVFHDEGLKRLAGRSGVVWQHTLAEMASLRIGGTEDRAPTLGDALSHIGGRVPVIIELKGSPGHDDGLVERVAAHLKDYAGKAAIMSFDHWLIREFAQKAPGVPGGLTAMGKARHDIEAHFSMLAHEIAFVSYDVDVLPNPFVTFVRKRLRMPVITWTVQTEAQVELTRVHADQMTFEGFEPPLARIA